MPHSYGLHSPLDSPEPSLSDLFGSTTSADSSIALSADSVSWAHIDNGSVEMDTALVHIDSDGMVTSFPLGLDGIIDRRG